MVSSDDNGNGRPVWFVSGGPNWWLRRHFWQCEEHDHRDVIRGMRPGDRIAMKTDHFQDRRVDDQGNPVPSVGIWAIGTIESINRRFVYVNWNDIASHGPLRNCRVDTITARFPEDDCIWKMEPSDDAVSTFVTETFGSEPEPARTYTIDSIIAEGCFLKRVELAMMLQRLQTKRNLILQGPPGTGKTWLAKKLAYALIGYKDDSKVRPLQFHPNLSYEDFVRGWRPQVDGKLELVDGPFLQLIVEAEQNPDDEYVMVIEEINRGNPAQIFGEMLTLLESDKRTPNEALALAYPRAPGERVNIPPNVHVIGTMNVADRSLAMVDFALRRRFAFFDLEPIFSDVWRNWVHSECHIPENVLADIARRMTALNDKIANDRNLGKQFRIGHSYFSPRPETSIDNYIEWFTEVVETEIRPLLNEYWFDYTDEADAARSELLSNLSW